MDNHSIADGVAAVGLFLFTGVETLGVENIFFEVISKFGVVAVLWFWLRDMKQQMKEMLLTFDKETTEIRADHKAHIEQINTQYNAYKQTIEKQLEASNEQIKSLQQRISA
jgi:hypothetical protein